MKGNMAMNKKKWRLSLYCLWAKLSYKSPYPYRDHTTGNYRRDFT